MGSQVGRQQPAELLAKHFGDGFFQDNPQEFVASIASAYSDDESCAFYRIEPNGRTTVRRCAIEKTDGIVTSIAYRGKRPVARSKTAW